MRTHPCDHLQTQSQGVHRRAVGTGSPAYLAQRDSAGVRKGLGRSGGCDVPVSPGTWPRSSQGPREREAEGEAATELVERGRDQGCPGRGWRARSLPAHTWCCPRPHPRAAGGFIPQKAVCQGPRRAGGTQRPLVGTRRSARPALPFAARWPVRRVPLHCPDTVALTRPRGHCERPCCARCDFHGHRAVGSVGTAGGGPFASA